ncbi:MAG: hypothetical protein AAF514_19625 [Verrucomicrobiota bacterium]
MSGIEGSEVEDTNPTLEAVRRATRMGLVRWGIRTVIGAVIFTAVAMKVPWGKWLFAIWLPLAFGSLAVLLIHHRKASELAAKVAFLVEEDHDER